MRLPEPHELADAWIAAQDEARERILRGGTCCRCRHYKPAPKEWAHIDFGWCVRQEDWTEADHPAYECDVDYEEAA